MSLIPYVWIWAVLAAIVLAVAFYRQILAHRDDESLHVVESDPGLIAEQTKASKKIGVLDRCGQSLTVVAIVYGLVLVGVYLYHIWLQSGRLLPR